MGSQRLANLFRRVRKRHQPGLIPFVTVGFPDVDTTLELVPALESAGADGIELGVPFSDPLADGPTIQRASYRALRQGVTLRRCLEVCHQLRLMGVQMPMVLMGYYNPVLSYGIEVFAKDAAAAGIDGLIVADLPPEEADPVREACAKKNMALIALLAPTSTDERIARACQGASGFIYCVSLTGVTGAREHLPPGVFQLLQRVRHHTDLPLAVGFGVSRHEHIQALGQYAEAAIVGSALINVLDTAPDGQKVEEACRFISRLAGRTDSGDGVTL